MLNCLTMRPDVIYVMFVFFTCACVAHNSRNVLGRLNDNSNIKNVGLNAPSSSDFKAMDYLGEIDNFYWKDLDIIYPMRRYHSPPLDPLTEHHVAPLSRTVENGGDGSGSDSSNNNNNSNSNSNNMRFGLSAMMDRLLFIRRLPGGGWLNY